LGGTVSGKASVLRGIQEWDLVAFSVLCSKNFRGSRRSKAGVRDGKNHGMDLVGDLKNTLYLVTE